MQAETEHQLQQYEYLRRRGPLQAAIHLGNWLLASGTLQSEQRQHVKQQQAVLLTLKSKWQDLKSADTMLAELESELQPVSVELARVLRDHASVLTKQHRLVEAKALLASSTAIFAEHQEKVEEATNRRFLTRVLVEEGNFEEAYAVVSAAYEVITYGGDGSQQLFATLDKAEFAAYAGDHRTAVQFGRKALDLARYLGMRSHRLRALAIILLARQPWLLKQARRFTY